MYLGGTQVLLQMYLGAITKYQLQVYIIAHKNVNAYITPLTYILSIIDNIKINKMYMYI